MNPAPHDNTRCWGALGILLFVIALAGAGGFIGYSVLQAQWMELDAQQSQLDALRRRPSQTANQKQEETTIAVDPFLKEDNFALSANALQRRVVELIEGTEGKLLTVSVDPQIVGDKEQARRVTVQVSAELTNDELQKVLYELESEPPYVFVETLAASKSERGESNAAAAHREPILAVNMTVVGYRRKAG